VSACQQAPEHAPPLDDAELAEPLELDFEAADDDDPEEDEDAELVELLELDVEATEDDDPEAEPDAEEEADPPEPPHDAVGVEELVLTRLSVRAILPMCRALPEQSYFNSQFPPPKDFAPPLLTLHHVF
jgi:hypothetical protein